MRRFRRIVVVVVVTLGTIFIGAQWVAPVVMSIETARKPPRDTRLVPVNLQDLTISQAPGRKLSYFGYEFEIPWNDIDEASTKSDQGMVWLTFHSGLKLMVGASPPKLWLSGPFGKSVEQGFGAHSDYDFLKAVYGFTPDKMRLWAFSPHIHYRETLLLSLKSAAVLPEAETGFFYVGNSMYKGFQEGDPQSWPSNYRPKSRSAVFIQLFSDQGSLDLTLFQKDLQNPAGISQAELNRIVQTVHRVQGEFAGTSTSLQ